MDANTSAAARRDVVVIGASAGGVRALRELVSALPPKFGAAVFIVLHIGAHSSTLPDILGHASPSPVTHAVDGESFEPGRIYVAPPDHHLLLEAGRMRVTRGPKEHHTRPAVDPLFRSAALSLGSRVIGVLLTGRLDDGTAGLQAIKACGGLVLVQDPDEAEEPGMPQSALRHVVVDHCLPLGSMAMRLAELVGTAAPRPAPAPRQMELEHAMTLGLQNGVEAMSELEAIASPTTLVCPECSGSLWEVKGTDPSRYRCHTGHAFSLRTLQMAQEESTEQALWSAIRALHERQMLLHQTGALALRQGDEAAATASGAEAARVANQIMLLRDLLESR